MQGTQSGGSAGHGSRGAARPRRLTCHICRASASSHCGGINSLAVSADGQSLFTASRDSTIKRWDISQGGTPRFQASFEQHTDWVNDVVLVGDTLVSCSSDDTVALWRSSSPGGAGSCLGVFPRHSDYVTCLAGAEQRGWVVSGGLRGEIMLWDLAATMKAGPSARPFELRNSTEGGSIYALSFCPSGRILASGCSDRLVQLWDPRQPGASMALKGHTGNIRSLALNQEGSMLLSGGSDGKIRLWDLGQQRCVHVFGFHMDSVWSLQATNSFRHVYSGSRDGTVFRTCLSTRSSDLVLRESGPVLSLVPEEALLSGGSSVTCGNLWVGTTSSHTNCWQVPVAPEPSSNGAHQQASLSPEPSSVRRSVTLERGKAGPPLVASPATRITGVPPLVNNTVLNDRHHVLTKDADGAVELWDLTTGTVSKKFGAVDFKETEKSLFQAMNVPQWFTTDTKTGSLQVHLDSPQCFLAEIYAQDLGVTDAPDDLKYNFGEQMLKGLFAGWLTARGLRSAEAPPGEPPQSFAGVQGRFLYGKKTQQSGGGMPVPSLMCEDCNGVPWRRRVTDFDGSEIEGEHVPAWAVECVLHGQLPQQRDMKCAFVLQPRDGSSLPAMLQTRLNAPRVLRISKVASYALTKLAEQDIAMIVQPPDIDITGGQGHRPPQAPASPNSQGLPILDITCNKMAVPFDMSLDSVRLFIWKRSDDLVLEYFERPAGAPAPPLPRFQPPS